MIDLELIFSAVGVDDIFIHRWIKLNAPVLELCEACVVTDSLTDFPELRRVVRVDKPRKYNIGAINNRGIWSSEARIIVKTDVDIVHSLAEINDIWTNVCVGTAVISKCANIDIDELDNKKWSNLPIRRAGRGASFAMHIQDWHRLRGFDERFIGWGGDDDDIYRRAKAIITVEQHQKHPLYHINHKPRKSDYFPDHGQNNLKIVEDQGPWHRYFRSIFWGQPWENREKWGEAKLIGEEKLGANQENA